MARATGVAGPGADSGSLEVAGALHQAGRYGEAEAAYQALLRGPGSRRRVVLRLLALLYRQDARPDAALACYDQLLAMGERDAELFVSRGDLLYAAGRLDAALQSYDRAVAQDPRSPEALNNRGATLAALGRAGEALASYDAALILRVDYAEAWFNRGVALVALDRAEEALASYDRALAVQPADARAWTARGVLLAAGRRHGEALASYDQALAVEADFTDALNNRSASLRVLGRFHEALDSADLALAQRPHAVEVLNSRALALAALMQFEAALVSYDAALALQPDYPEALSNSGLALAALGRWDDALERYQAALALDPGFTEAAFNKGLTLLRLGRFEAGWPLYESRWRRPGVRPQFASETLWLGGGELAGKTVLLHAEQGLGDTLQFCRFASIVAARGARVVMQVQPPLLELITAVAGVAEVVSTGAPAPRFDLHCPLLSLPLALGGDAEALGGAAYLTADPHRVEAWRSRLGEPQTRLRVGLTWSGNPAHENDHNRSIPLAQLGALLQCDADFVCLQKEIAPQDQALLSQDERVQRLDDGIGDFADTAALTEACDLVVTVDTAVAHLAGTLGRPTWILLPKFADWRWRAQSPPEPASDLVAAYDETPWYGSARLYRQREFSDWAEVIERVAAALTRKAADWTPAALKASPKC